MDATSREKAYKIADGWGLPPDEREQLLNQPDAAPQVISIHDALHRLFGNREQADAWISKPNRAFQGQSGLEVMLAGDIEQVHRHLKYHLYNA